MKRIYFLVILLALILFIFTCVRDAQASMQIGLQDDGAALTAPGPAVQQIQAMETHQFRILVDVDGRGLAAYDPAIQAAHAAGLTVFLTLTDYKDKSVIQQAVNMWPFVTYWSFWNEPELTGPPPHSLRYIYKFGIRAVHRTNPSARILEGEVACWQGALDYMKLLGPLPHVYGLAVHPYWLHSHQKAPGSVRHLRNWTRMLARRGWRKLHHHLLITEYGEWGPGQSFSAIFRSQPVQVAAQHLRLALRYARKAKVREFIYYHVSPTEDRWDTGLINPDGSPRPDYYVIEHAIRHENSDGSSQVHAHDPKGRQPR